MLGGEEGDFMIQSCICNLAADPVLPQGSEKRPGVLRQERGSDYKGPTLLSLKSNKELREFVNHVGTGFANAFNQLFNRQVHLAAVWSAGKEVLIVATIAIGFAGVAFHC